MRGKQKIGEIGLSFCFLKLSLRMKKMRKRMHSKGAKLLGKFKIKPPLYKGISSCIGMVGKGEALNRYPPSSIPTIEQ